jgi:serine/threonine protein kinase
MELCGHNTLSTFAREQGGTGRLPEDICYKIFAQIVAGVDFMHQLNFAHRDLKMTNILIDNNLVVKIIDFGFACNSGKIQNMYCGTPSYMPPEIVQRSSYLSKPVDVWTLGCVLYKLVTGEYPFGGRIRIDISRE